MRWERHCGVLGHGEALIERRAQRPGERTSDGVETVQAKPFTLSRIGIVRNFSWEGEHLCRALTTFMDPQAMTIAGIVQTRGCVPKQPYTFKDEPEFADTGFSSGAPYSVRQTESRTFGEENENVEDDEL